jgi:D-alanyl-lipoteichoic acid acyltransferase DltB (MBOAT superfamily)
MLFNSLEFLLFFPAVVTGYFLLPHRHRWWWLLGASSAFYMAFVPKYILILFFTIAVDYVAGLLIAGASGARRKLLLTASIVANVGVLCVFKYWEFLRDNVGQLAHLASVSNPLPALHIVLPIGLSFHTFQAMSYTIEVYRGRQRPERHLGIYALYVMYFPQLVAGPIERPQNLLHQFHVEHRFEYDRVVSGLQQMAVGFFKKSVADRLAIVGEGGGIWTTPSQHSGLELLLAILCFTFRIYYDFSGYSDIALGASRVMGIELMTNFDLPYGSRSISEFWRRWHISLSTWFKDYLYVPLGGNRVGEWRRYRNLYIVFALSGLWHGANWTYVVWGLLHGTYLVFGQATGGVRARLWKWVGLADGTVHRTVSMVTTSSLVALAWIFFRAPSVAVAWQFLTRLPVGLRVDAARLASGHAVGIFQPTHLAFVGFLVVAVTLFEAVHRRASVFVRARGWPSGLRFGLYFGLVYGSLLLTTSGNVQFIYFQF